MEYQSRFSGPLFLLIVAGLTSEVAGFGAYMSALMRRQNHTFQGTKDLPHTTLVLDSHFERHEMSQLKNIDEKFSKCNGIEMRELTIFQVQEYFDTKELTSLELTNCYIRRIHHMNNILRAVLEINPDAINEAHKADMERLSEKVKRGPMHGIPVLIKDNVAVKHFMQTTAGSLALLGSIPMEDADVVKTLRKAGAVIIGKSNLSELSAFRGNLLPGWSGRGGQTKNPYNLNANPQGSSTGSAVGVSANLAMVSVGSETDGSLITPASAAGIFTLKPTLGTVSKTGVIPITSNQDCVGPMARSMVDLAILFDEMVSQNHKDKWACGGKYLSCLMNKSLFRKLRVGVLRYPFWDGNVIRSDALEYQLPHLDELVNQMQYSAHFDVTDPVAYPSDLLKNISCDKELIVMSHDFKHEINGYLKNKVARDVSEGYYDSLQSRNVRYLKDIIQFNNDYPDGHDQDVLIMAEATNGIQNKTYLHAKESNQMAARKLLNYTMQKYQLDALMFPNALPFALDYPTVTDGSLEDVPRMGYSLAAIAGYPSINVPAGIGLGGVPFGVTFIGMPNSELGLLQLGYFMERLNPARKPPQFHT